MERAIILAAGKGERLVSGKPYPKPLNPVNGVPLIVRVLRTLEQAGVQQVGIVVGYLGDTLVEGLRRHRFELDLQFVSNPEFDKPNGSSLLKAKALVTGPTFLLMSDHLFSPDLIQRVRSFPLSSDEVVLGVLQDRRVCRPGRRHQGEDPGRPRGANRQGTAELRCARHGRVPDYPGCDRSARACRRRFGLLAVAGHGPARGRRPDARG